MIFYMYVMCELSHEHIAFHLNRLGITPQKTDGQDSIVYGILTNPVYIGRELPHDILEDIEVLGTSSILSHTEDTSHTL